MLHFHSTRKKQKLQKEIRNHQNNHKTKYRVVEVLLHKWLLPLNFRDLMKTSVFNETSIVFTKLYLDMLHNVPDKFIV